MRLGAFGANLAVLLLFGVGVPWMKGIDFLDLFLLLPYSLLAVFYVSPRAISIAMERPISLGALGRAAITGWAIGVVILILGFTTVSWRAGHTLLPPTPVLLCLLVLSLMACVITAAAAVRVALGAATEDIARRRIRIGFLVLLCLLLAVPRMLSEDATIAMLNWMTPEGMVRLTMILAPVMAIGSLVLLRAKLARYTG